MRTRRGDSSMKLVIQRVTRASVHVDGREISSIDQGGMEFDKPRDCQCVLMRQSCPVLPMPERCVRNQCPIQVWLDIISMMTSIRSSQVLL